MQAKLKKLPAGLKRILEVVSGMAAARGMNIYIVGGAARDLILGKVIIDLDVAVEGDAITLAHNLAVHLKGNFCRHHAFGTATAEIGEYKIDFAAARKEDYSHWGALPKVVPAAIKEDLSRRDFTINAMAISLNRADYGTLLDLYGGVADLKRGIIRVLHPKSFLEDPTRILRAVRFEQRFYFSFDKDTRALMDEALRADALKLVNLHRLRDELILILKEPAPRRYVKRVDDLTGFAFIDESIALSADDFKLLDRIEKAISWYYKTCKKHRRLDEWVVYASAILLKIPDKKADYFLYALGFRKGERLRIESTRDILRLRRIADLEKPHAIYRFLERLSYEAVIFIYAYFTDKPIRKKIAYFLDKLVHIRLKIQGRDLKGEGLRPYSSYGEVMAKVLDIKMDKGLENKDDEMREARGAFKKLSLKNTSDRL